MKIATNVYDGLKVKAAALLRLDRFSLSFSDGTDVTLTLRQIQAIRMLPYSTSGIRISALPLLPLLVPVLPVEKSVA